MLGTINHVTTAPNAESAAQISIPRANPSLKTLLYVTLSVLPIIPVGSRTVFALKIGGLIVLANLVGVALYVAGQRRSVSRIVHA